MNTTNIMINKIHRLLKVDLFVKPSSSENQPLKQLMNHTVGGYKQQYISSLSGSSQNPVISLQVVVISLQLSFKLRLRSAVLELNAHRCSLSSGLNRGNPRARCLSLMSRMTAFQPRHVSFSSARAAQPSSRIPSLMAAKSLNDLCILSHLIGIAAFGRVAGGSPVGSSLPCRCERH